MTTYGYLIDGKVICWEKRGEGLPLRRAYQIGAAGGTAALVEAHQGAAHEQMQPRGSEIIAHAIVKTSHCPNPRRIVTHRGTNTHR